MANEDVIGDQQKQNALDTFLTDVDELYAEFKMRFEQWRSGPLLPAIAPLAVGRTGLFLRAAPFLEFASFVGIGSDECGAGQVKPGQRHKSRLED